jgi:glycosyltransferase involved in cell wall biosynthesis
VSVILCTYDREKSLRRAADSVLRQKFTDFELVVVDDGSTDRTPEIALELAQRDRRIVYVRQANRGLAAARNVGIALARGTWVTFIDSDDTYLPEHLSTRLALANESAVDAVFGGVKLVGPRRSRYVADMDRPGRKIHLSHCHIGGTLFVRRRVLDAVGGFREVPYSEDHDLMLRIERRYRVKQCRRRTYVYHLTAADRLGKLYLRGGAAAIRRLRDGVPRAA